MLYLRDLIKWIIIIELIKYIIIICGTFNNFY